MALSSERSGFHSQPGNILAALSSSLGGCFKLWVLVSSTVVLRVRFLIFHTLELPGGLVKAQTGGGFLSVLSFWFSGPGAEPRVCASNKFPGGADAAGPGTTLGEPPGKRILNVADSDCCPTEEIVRGASKWDREAGNWLLHPRDAQVGAWRPFQLLQQSKNHPSTQKWHWTDPAVSSSLREASLREALRRVGWRRDRASSSALSGEEEEMWIGVFSFRMKEGRETVNSLQK